MSGQPGGMTSGDPLGGGAPAPPRDPSGLPGVPRPEAPARGYTSPPPPGAGGDAPIYQQAAQPPAYGQYLLAGWGSRAGAQLIDGLIIGVGATILLIPIAAAAGFSAFDQSEGGLVAAMLAAIAWVVCLAIVALVYAPAMMSRTNGQTLGRMATNIRVVRTSGEPITFGFAMLREVVVKTILFGFAGTITGGLANLVDYLWPLWDEENRALHDFVVNTRTVKD